MSRAAHCLGAGGQRGQVGLWKLASAVHRQMQNLEQPWQRTAGSSPATWASEAGEGLEGATPCCVCPDSADQGFLLDPGPPSRGQVVLRTNHLTKWQLLTRSPRGMASILTSAPGIA